MKARGPILLVAVWLAIFIAVETGAWFAMRSWIGRHPSDNELVNEYARRGHPLFTDNSDLRAKELGYAFDPYLGYVLRANQRYPYLHLGRMSHLETDAAGRVHNGDPGRNPRLFARPGAEVYRVVLFGGSTMIGQNASDNAHTLPAYVERMLEAKWPGIAFQVINAGVFGYQSTQERLSYELAFRAMRPDLVIFLDGFNDAAAPSVSAQWQAHSSNMIMTPEAYVAQFSPSRALAAWASNLLRFPEPLATLAWLRRGLARMAPPPGAPTGSARVAHYHPDASSQLVENVSGLAAQVEAAGGRAIFALQPFIGAKKPALSEAERGLLLALGDEPKVIGRYFTDFEQAWRGLGASNTDRIRFLDMTGAFQETATHVYDDIVHYNDAGNEILAARLLAGLGDGISADLRRKGMAP
jgi:lysophospholipase L1-like esterase